MRKVFGYIRICKPQMKICEYDTYQSVYCTLCRHLGKQLGLPARLLLNYDYTFMTMIMIALSDEPSAFIRGRCAFNPLKRCGNCTTHNEAFEYTSALTAIMFYHKLRDNIQDTSGVKRLLWRLLMPYAALVRKRAMKRFPDEDALVNEYLRRQFETEQSASPDNEGMVDALCQPTADVISAFAVRLSEKPEDKTILRYFGYFLGRWIYMIDALDDLDEDVMDGAFNPLALRFALTAQDITDRSERREEARAFGNDSLNLSVAEAVKYYELLDLGAFKPILDNIMYLGISDAQKSALLKENAKFRKSKHHSS
ncbi:MAG: hypothetical protein II828_08915 [Clostridia bacterium]|nr:hypothetical protein [Clostridia bacterium]